MVWSENLNGKQIKLTIGVVLVLSGYIFGSYSPNSPLQRVFYPVQYEAGGPYTVFQRGGYYGFFQGESRYDAELSRDASYIFQRVFSLARSGGRIFIRKGVYQLKTPLVLEEGWHLVVEGEDEYSTVLLYTGGPARCVLQLEGGNQGTKLSGFTLSGSTADIALVVNTSSYQSLIELDHLQVGWNFRFSEWGGHSERTDFGLFVYGCDVLRVSNCDIYGNDVGVRIGSGMNMFFSDCDFAVLPVGGEEYRVGFWANNVVDDGWGMEVFEGTVFIERCSNNAPLSTGYLLRSIAHMEGCYMENGLRPLILRNCAFNVRESNFMTEPGTECVVDASGSVGYFQNNVVTIHPENHEIQYLLSHIFEPTPQHLIHFENNRVHDYGGNLPFEAFYGSHGQMVVLHNSEDLVDFDVGRESIVGGRPAYFFDHGLKGVRPYHFDLEWESPLPYGFDGVLGYHNSSHLVLRVFNSRNMPAELPEGNYRFRWAIWFYCKG